MNMADIAVCKTCKTYETGVLKVLKVLMTGAHGNAFLRHQQGRHDKQCEILRKTNKTQ